MDTSANLTKDKKGSLCGTLFFVGMITGAIILQMIAYYSKIQVLHSLGFYFPFCTTGPIAIMIVRQKLATKKKATILTLLTMAIALLLFILVGELM